MKPENAIEVKNITKKFKVYLDKGHTLKEKTLFRSRRKYEERNVLNGISFEVKKGEAIGLIGHNGCGKSTTLKLLTKIMYPDSGAIEMKGRVSSLIELGAGFHPDMSGRDNIYTNASIFGLTKKEIDERLDDIIAFSELEEFIDNPVRTYSSGMYMRLAFSVAINVDADILLIDEILAVGDATFQAKCFNKLREIKSQGATIVIVSHSLGQIEQICDECLWIDNGIIRMQGEPTEVDYAYLDYMGEKARKIKNIKKNGEKQIEIKSNTDNTLKNEKPTKKDEKENKILQESKEVGESIREDNDTQEEYKKEIEIIKVELVDSEGHVQSRYRTGDKAILRVRYHCNSVVEKPLMGIKIIRNDGVEAFGTNTQNERIKLQLKEEGIVECTFDTFNLVAAQYYIDVAFRSQDMLVLDYKTRAFDFEMYYPIYEIGISHIDHIWNFI